MNRYTDTFARYGAFGMLRLFLDKLFSAVAFPGTRLVRRPCYVRGRSSMQIGHGLTTGPGMRLDAFPAKNRQGPVLRIGRDVQLNDYVHIAAIDSVTIGDRVLIASKVFISDHNHGRYSGDAQDSPLSPPSERLLSSAPVLIEDDVWLGEGVVVLPGVHIGKGAVVGALSVVIRDVPAYCIAVGSPAKVVKYYDFESSVWTKV